MKWSSITNHLAICTETGVKVYKPALFNHYCVISPNKVWLGVIYDKGDIEGFLKCGSFTKPQTQELLL